MPRLAGIETAFGHQNRRTRRRRRQIRLPHSWALNVKNRTLFISRSMRTRILKRSNVKLFNRAMMRASRWARARGARLAPRKIRAPSHPRARSRGARFLLGRWYLRTRTARATNACASRISRARDHGPNIYLNFCLDISKTSSNLAA